MEERLLGGLEAEVPGRVPGLRPGRPRDLAGAEDALADADVVPYAGIRLRHSRLRGARPVRRGVEEREPQRALRLRSRALVDRVADPHAERLRGVAGLEVEALVVPGLPVHP